MTDLLVEDVAPIYKKNYWDRVKGDHSSGLDLCVFDFHVNAGTGRAAQILTNNDWHSSRRRNRAQIL